MAEKTYVKFVKQYLGQKVDVDGFPANQPYQCWDYVSGKYFPYIGGKMIHCRQSGYVKDIANQRATNGILDFCVDVGLKETLQIGDICIWGNTTATPWSHIAIYDHDNGQNEVYFSGQNQSVPYVNIAELPTKGIIGVFRPKIFVNKKVTPVVKKADQILTVGSVVRSEGFYVEKIDYIKKMIYNAWIGGWVPWAMLDEVDKRDGKKDQILHIGSGVALHGTFTVSKVDVKYDRVYLKELRMWVKSRAMYELKDGK